ncbi:hypothetical protein AX774_g4067 [Zancudomyces culisetae]|uniref:Uncharacterized protein n=1 Tax=Zancudomyces culisetae TaxID=1213189 RepID=A0A1R1PNH4_ZANCU|nr:hypothetical protein AX774_g7972 [Zancudomyces culisetae]OMH82452.1 hypothetical protein AX774_g4067 [Zancudomyces culisetae]|eukprot:OMH78640.1 hypothetical protein AX774_g7972 [Zancudomyces culisetae]
MIFIFTATPKCLTLIETGEVPQHHELLPSYEHALGAPNVSVGRPPVVVSTNRAINPSHNNAGGNSTDVCGGEYAGTDLPPSYRP